MQNSDYLEAVSIVKKSNTMGGILLVNENPFDQAVKQKASLTVMMKHFEDNNLEFSTIELLEASSIKLKSILNSEDLEIFGKALNITYPKVWSKFKAEI